MKKTKSYPEQTLLSNSIRNNNMDGVIIIADDELNSLEFMREIYYGLVKYNKYPVLGIDNLDLTMTSILSINNIKALIIDYNFKEKSDDEQLPDIERKASEILENKKLHLFTLIYVYSQEELENTVFGEALKERFGENSVRFRLKSSDDRTSKNEYESIIADIEKWETEHKHLEVPSIWNRSLGQAVQNIFHSLDKADPLWIKDLYFSSFFMDKKGIPIQPPPVDPNVQVINLFQNILAEHLIQNMELRESIEKYSNENFKNATKDNEIVNLYHHLFYTKTNLTDAIMTGDIFDLGDNSYGVIISPECDMLTLISKDKSIEILVFQEDAFKGIDKLLNIRPTEKREEIINRAYNQETPRFHLLPHFNTKNNRKITALIDFRFSLTIINGFKLKEDLANRRVKINSPYIQQLRQRYLAYIGRVGVPSIPQSLRIHNLK